MIYISLERVLLVKHKILSFKFQGKYIPYLTNLILQKQKEGKKEDYLNLKGILMGNAMLNPV